MVITLVLGGVLAPLVSRYDIYAPYWMAVVLFSAAGILILFARIPRAEAFAATGRRAFHQLAVELRGIEAEQAAPVCRLLPVMHVITAFIYQ